jgi:cation transport ATPase
MKYLLAYGSIPVITESLDSMSEDVSEADHPALLAMQFGLVLNEPFAALTILLMLTGGEALEDYAMERAQQGLHTLLEQEPGKAMICLEDGSRVEFDATDVKEGDVVMVREGETAPVDCDLCPEDGGDSARRMAFSNPKFIQVD